VLAPETTGMTLTRTGSVVPRAAAAPA
jgi:hypothetical protein